MDRRGEEGLRRGTRTTYSAAVAVMVTRIAAGGRKLLADGRDGGGDDDDGREVYAIGLWGDFPYSSIQATVGVPNLIADMNAQRLAFTVHDGDLKTGNG